jgi:hypothetical protein
MIKEEEMLLRQLAAGQCTIQRVINAIGPLSLWSKDGLEAEIRKAVEEEREACAKLADEWAVGWPHPSKVIALDIRARGQA